MSSSGDRQVNKVPIVRTVKGDISPDTCGVTLCHEHLRIELKKIFQVPSDKNDFEKAFSHVTLENLGWVRANYINNLDNLGLYEEQLVVDEVSLFREAGGSTLVEVTPVDIGRNPVTLERIADRTGLNIVMGCGYYVFGTHPEDLRERSEESLAEEMSNDVQIGVANTGIRAGIIGEIGCSWPLHRDERKVLTAAAQAQARVNCALTIHPGRDPNAPIEILEIIDKAGGDITKTIMGHLDRTYHSSEALLNFAKMGAYLEFDMFGLESAYYPFGDMDMPNDGRRIDSLLKLIDAGFGDRILVSHDIAFKHALVKYGGFGYAHILQNAVPKMIAKGITKDQVRLILENNPSEALAFNP